MFMTEFQFYLENKQPPIVKILLKYLAEYLKELNRSNDKVRDFLTDAQINALGPVIKESLLLTKEYKEAYLKQMAEEKSKLELDEEDVERFIEESAKVSKVASYVMELTGQLCEIFQTRAENVVKENAHWYFEDKLKYDNTITNSELLDCLCYFCDFVDNTSIQTETNKLYTLTNTFLKVLNTEHG